MRIVLNDLNCGQGALNCDRGGPEPRNNQIAAAQGMRHKSTARIVKKLFERVFVQFFIQLLYSFLNIKYYLRVNRGNRLGLVKFAMQSLSCFIWFIQYYLKSADCVNSFS